MSGTWLIATGRYFYYEACPCCKGEGRTPKKDLGAYYIDYHYQDGHEQAGPYSKEEAVKIMRSHRDGTSHATLIGPDGQIYWLEG